MPRKSPAQLDREIAQALDSPPASRRSTSPEWVGEVVDAARPVLQADRDLAIVTWPVGKRPALYGSYKLRTARPGERPSSKLRPYFATLAKATEDKINGYVVVRYGDKIIVYLSPDTILARSEVG
jgi:hypothetical protein